MSATFLKTGEWICRKDARTQRTYYVSRRTGRSTWDPVHRTAADTEPASALYRAEAPVVDLSGATLPLASTYEAGSSPATPQVVTVPPSVVLTKNSQRSTAPATSSTADTRESLLVTAAAPAKESEEHLSLAASKEAPTHAVFVTDFSSSHDSTSPVSVENLHRAHPQSPPELAQKTPVATLPSHSPLGRQTAVTTESSASPSSNRTQRPSDYTAAFPLVVTSSSSSSSSHLQQQQSQMPPPLLLPSSTVFPPAEPHTQDSARDSVNAGVTHSSQEHVCPRSFSSSPPSPPSSQQQQQQQQQQPSSSSQLPEGAFDQEAAAAEEWRLTRRMWDLEGERARLESELAVLRGPVEVETQSIAEEYDRLLEAQRTLETAATLAMKQQTAKRAELEGLRQRLAELQEQRENSTFLISALQERLALVNGRCQKVQNEAKELRQWRKELEDVVAPSEEAAWRNAQRRLYEQRQRVSGQQQEVRERQRSLAQARAEVQRLKQRLEELSAVPLDDEGVSVERSEDHSLPSLKAFKEHRIEKENEPFKCRSSSGMSGALPIVVAGGCESSSALTQHGTQLSSRVAELRRDVEALQSASRALYENKLLIAQQHVLREWTEHLRGETEAWLPAVDEARAMLNELQQFSKTQAYTCEPSAAAI